jgi:hypothetical protein
MNSAQATNLSKPGKVSTQSIKILDMQIGIKDNKIFSL